MPSAILHPHSFFPQSNCISIPLFSASRPLTSKCMQKLVLWKCVLWQGPAAAAAGRAGERARESRLRKDQLTSPPQRPRRAVRSQAASWIGCAPERPLSLDSACPAFPFRRLSSLAVFLLLHFVSRHTAPRPSSIFKTLCAFAKAADRQVVSRRLIASPNLGGPPIAVFCNFRIARFGVPV